MEFDYSHTTEINYGLFKLQGKITELDSCERLLDEVDNYTLAGTSNIILDLSKLEYINSSGLNALISILTKTRNAGGDCILCNINESVNKLFIITKLNTLFVITETKDEATKLLNENQKV